MSRAPFSCRIALSLVLLICGSVPVVSHAVQAQGGDVRAPVTPLALDPAPSQLRLANGAPGPKYWQNRADYQIRATLSPSLLGTRQRSTSPGIWKNNTWMAK